MIRINLLKKERKSVLEGLKGLAGGLSGARLSKEQLLNTTPLFAGAIGAVLIGAQVYYMFQLKSDVASLKEEVSSLETQRNKLKKQAMELETKRKQLESKIKQIKTEIA